MTLDESQTLAPPSPALDRPVRPAAPAAPEIGDVIDALDDALAGFKVVVARQTQCAIESARSVVRKSPLSAVAIAAGLAWFVARVRR